MGGRALLDWSGNAGAWKRNAEAKGWKTTINPSEAVPGSAMVWTNGNGTTVGQEGHVAAFDRFERGTVHFTEMNWPLKSPAVPNSLSSSSLTRGKSVIYTFVGFILPDTTAPVISDVTASFNSAGDAIVTFKVTDATSISLTQTDAWLNMNGVVRNSLVRDFGTALGVRKMTIPYAQTQPLVDKGMFTVGVRAIDKRGLKAEAYSSRIQFISPGQPKMAIRTGTSVISSKSTVNMGTVKVNSGVTGTTLKFDIWNEGTATLSGVGKVSLSNTADFGISASPANTVAPKSNTSFSILFAPKSKGMRTSTVTISGFTFTVTGSGY